MAKATKPAPKPRKNPIKEAMDRVDKAQMDRMPADFQRTHQQKKKAKY